MKCVDKIILSSFLLFFSTLSEAKLIQIIHTNDLHSYFSGYYTGMGGYPRLMTKIKELKADAASKGIEVLQVDAGDWGEGTSYFHSDNGSDSIRALEMLGVEVATIGNHDHLLGGKDLSRQIRAANVSTKFTAANLVTTPEMELQDIVVPYVDVDKGGIPIRVIGLTTPESFFQYSMFPGKVALPNPIGEAEAKKAKLAKRELVIALTHLGVTADVLLARNSSNIDVIIGGHSHTQLNAIRYQKNRLAKPVPIVQAWAHGLAVGTLLLDVKENGGGVSVMEYKLHEIGAPLEADPVMTEFVAAAGEKRNQNLSFKWDEIIGETETPMTGYVNGNPVYKWSCWGRHMATASRQAGKAHVGIHVSSFEGVYKPAGTITYADLADNFPHFRKFGDQGWEIATAKMSGLKLRFFMWWISRQGYGITFSGLGYKRMADGRNILMVNDEEIDDKAVYTIAFPAEVALAINTSFPGYRHYLWGLTYTGKYFWTEMVDYIKKNSPLSCR